jgi:hypothetical protein
MSRPPETRICPICHSLLWEEDFLRPEDLEVWEGERHRGNGGGAGEEPGAELLELAELILELFLTLDADDREG